MEYKKKVKIANKLGFHLRAVAVFVKEAERFKSDIKIKYEDLEADGKSIMGVMSLAAPFESEVEITSSGPDSKEAMAKLVKIIENKFGED